jgi:hypothetical protein
MTVQNHQSCQAFLCDAACHDRAEAGISVGLYGLVLFQLKSLQEKHIGLRSKYRMYTTSPGDGSELAILSSVDDSGYLLHCR